MKKPQLYIKNERGRYEPYREPERPKRDNAFYRRIGNRYEPWGMVFNSVKSWQEGVFAVTRVRSSVSPDSWTSAEYLQEIFKLYRCGDIENVSIGKLGGMEKLAAHLASHWNEIGGDSVFEMAASVVAILMNYENKKEVKR
jgi:hypothetical protein